MHVIRPLTGEEISSEAFRKLLWFSVEVDDDALDHIVAADLPYLTVIGVIESGVVAFVAYRDAETPVVIEYIAVAEERRGQTLGSILVKAVARQNPGATIYAQTDDDAVEFYRALGFEISPRDSDPRWPGRQRYDCVLAPA